MADDAGTTESPVAEPWEPLSVVDFCVLGLVGTFQAFAVLICVHLIWCRKWPPYVTKNVDLVVTSAIFGVLWTFAMANGLGFIRRERGDILAACDFERFLIWSTLCVHVVASFVRVYRMWRILIKHDQNMWHPGHQILLFSSVCLIPVVLVWIAPNSGYFDETTNMCSRNPLILVGMSGLAFLGICFIWFVCSLQLKSVRRQFNEYETMRRTVVCMILTLISFQVVMVLLEGDDVLKRRVGILYPLLVTYIPSWGFIREPFIMKMLGDKDYLWSYTKGFAELPSPAQLKASLAEQLSVEQLREEFRRYIQTKVAQELVDFYVDSLDREEIKGFFERQAVTMRIVERYIREGAPDQVNISGECREKILGTDVMAFDIFDEARAEVLALMETNFQRGFVETEGFQRIQDASEREQQELRMLRAGGILPLGTPSTPSPAAGSTLAPSSPLTAGNQRRPGSPSLLAGLVDAIRKLPSFLTNARAASDRRRNGGRTSGGARAGGAARVSADSLGASDSEERRDGGTPVESDLVLARRLQREEEAVVMEAREVPRSEAAEACESRDSEMGGGRWEGGGRS